MNALHVGANWGTYVVIIVSVLATVIVCGTASLLLNARRSYKRAETTLIDRSLSRLPDSSSYEMWREAADQSQEASDKRRRRMKHGVVDNPRARR